MVVYPEWLYISEKEWALYHATQRIMFDEIVDVSSREKWIFWTFFWFWKLKISIMWTWEDYEFRYCKNISRVPTQLNERRIEYLKLKSMKKKIWDENYQRNIEVQKRNIKASKECKPFKSRIRNDLIKALNLKK